MKPTSKRMITPALRIALFATLLALGGQSTDVVPSARAQAPAANAKENKRKCSEQTVKGTYAFALTGTVKGIGPIAASGTTTFDGEGNFFLTGSINATELTQIVEGTFNGTYEVDPDDCTGTTRVAIPGGLFGITELTFKGVILDGGREIRYLITNPGVAFAGAAAKQ